MQDRADALKLAFDLFKHMTTLAGAGVLALVAVYKEELLDQRLLLFALFAFAISALVSVRGLGYTITATMVPTLPLGLAAVRKAMVCVGLSTGTLTGALGAVIIGAISLPWWAWGVIGLAAGITMYPMLIPPDRNQLRVDPEFLRRQKPE